MGVFSIALATVILPGLSSHHAEESPEKFNATLDWALRLTLTVVDARGRRAPHALRVPLIATIVRLRRLHAPRRTDVQLCIDGLFAGPHRLLAGQGAGARLFRAPGHEDAGQGRHHRAVDQHGVQRRCRRAGLPERIPGAAHPARGVDRPLGDSSTRRCCIADCAARAFSSHPRPGSGSCRRSVFASVAMAAFLWWISGDWSAWTEWHATRRALLARDLRSWAVGSSISACWPRGRAPARPEASIIAGHFPIRQAMLIRRGFEPCRDADRG